MIIKRHFSWFSGAHSELYCSFWAWSSWSYRHTTIPILCLIFRNSVSRRPTVNNINYLLSNVYFRIIAFVYARCALHNYVHFCLVRQRYYHWRFLLPFTTDDLTISTNNILYCLVSRRQTTVSLSLSTKWRQLYVSVHRYTSRWVEP